MTTGEKYTIIEEVNNGTLSADVKVGDGVSENWISGSVSDGTASKSLELFAKTSSTCDTDMVMFYFKFYKDGVLLLDLVPVKVGDTVNGVLMSRYGLYDKISGTYK